MTTVEETTQICQAVAPEQQSKLPDIIDTVHRPGCKKKEDPKQRELILLIPVWKAAKKSAYRNNAKDLSKGNREKRKQLWLVAEKERTEGKTAPFIGGCAFMHGSEVSLPA